MDYADGLAWFRDDQRAWEYFEAAIDFHPEQNIEAINRYAHHRLHRNQAKEALDILESRLTREARVIYVFPAHLRKESLILLGQDTSSADEEIAVMRRRVADNGHSAAVRFLTREAESEERTTQRSTGFLDLLSTSAVQAATAWQHNHDADDCRVKDWSVYPNFCDSGGNCFTPMAINLAELIDNEAQGESPGARYAVGWAAKIEPLKP